MKKRCGRAESVACRRCGYLSLQLCFLLPSLPSPRHWAWSLGQRQDIRECLPVNAKAPVLTSPSGPSTSTSTSSPVPRPGPTPTSSSAPMPTADLDITIGGAIDPQYYSKTGAWNGSGIAIASVSFGVDSSIFVYFQHYTGEIRSFVQEADG